MYCVPTLRAPSPILHTRLLLWFLLLLALLLATSCLSIHVYKQQSAPPHNSKPNLHDDLLMGSLTMHDTHPQLVGAHVVVHPAQLSTVLNLATLH
jgi:hypothetical protein